MMLNDENKNDFKKMMKGRAVYLALGVCVLAAGIVSYTSTLQKINRSVQPNEETEIITHVHIDDRPQTEPAQTQVSPPIAKPEETTPAAPTQEPQTEASPVFDNRSPTVADADTAGEEVSFSLPLSARMGDDYSMGVPVFSDTMGDYRTHNGVDFLGDAGTAVRAIGSGTVTKVTASALYGNTVTVDHGNGIVSTICGLANEGLVHAGDEVTADTVLGVVGSIPAEEKEGPHIHLEIRVNGILTDPLEILQIDPEEE
ncbi:MAG: peptidoglycan DD-metalloendopeptidase family protein [Clostridia bacterium]|nr:peptidoglycan DD-metalloendopeptidase family protein [Clostridia bacterium]